MDFNFDELFPNQSNYDTVMERCVELEGAQARAQLDQATRGAIMRQINLIKEWLKLSTYSPFLRTLTPVAARPLAENDATAHFGFWKQELRIETGEKKRRRCFRLGGEDVFVKMRTIRKPLVLGSLDEYHLGKIHGDIFIAKQPLERYAVKNFMKDLIGQAQENMGRELAIQHRLMQIDSPYFLALYNYMEIHDRYMALLPFMPNSDLLDYTATYVVSDLRPMMRSMLLALKVIHALGISHGDVSPENFLVQDTSTAILMDFGMASDMDENWTIDGSNFRGKRSYAAPEVIDFLTPRWDGRKIDVWSLGVTFFVMFTQKWPWQTASVKMNRDFRVVCHNINGYLLRFLPEVEVNRGLLDLLTLMLNLNPAQRPTVGELLRHPYFHIG